MTDDYRRFSVFLVPAPEERRWAETMIGKLATRYDVPAFEPHVTIYSGPYEDEADLENIRETLGKIAAEAGPISLKVKSLDASEDFFKTLFISFEEDPALRHIHQCLKNAHKRDDGYKLLPHLSLLYADIPLEEKKRAAGEIDLDWKRMRFEGLKLVLSNPDEGWADIGGWKTVFSTRLGTSGGEIKAVLFDFGGVLAEEGFRDGLMALARRQKLDPELVAEKGREIIHQSGYIIGEGTERGFWQIMRLRTNLLGSHQELSNTILNHFKLRPRMLQFARRLRAAGFTTAIVSDQTNWLERLNHRDGFYSEFDHVFNSYRLGKSKQDPSIFEDVARELGIEPKEALFTDDTPGHVARAESRGMNGIVFEDENQFIKKAETLLKIQNDPDTI